MKFLKKFFIFSVVSFMLVSTVMGVLLYRLFQELPQVEELINYEYNLPTKVFDRYGNLIDEYYKQKRILVNINDIPLVMKNAVIAIEDSRFYEHPGIDIRRIAKAFWIDLKEWAFVQGASTITQQTAKLFLLSSERKIWRKMKEIFLALKIEKRFSKEEILEFYLNKAYFGNGAWGIGAASKIYFSKKVQELNLAEASLLAGLVQAPTRLNPYKNHELALTRRNLVLLQMYVQKFIDKDEYQKTKAEDILLDIHLENKDSDVAYFIELIRRKLLEDFGNLQLYQGGLKVYTTLDVKIQKKAQTSLKQGLYAIDKRHGYLGSLTNITTSSDIEEKTLQRLSRNKIAKGTIVYGIVTGIKEEEATVNLGSTTAILPLETTKWAKSWDLKELLNKNNEVKRLQNIFRRGDVIQVKIESIVSGNLEISLYQQPVNDGGVFVMDLETGHVLAVIGGYDNRRSEFNRAIQSYRQPGSAFKPIIYAASLENGYTASSILNDTPFVGKKSKNIKWLPKNYGGRFSGTLTLREALYRSKNNPTIRIVHDLGTDNIIQYARKLGITSKLPNDLSLSLGSASLTLEQLVIAYGVFANKGNLIKPIYITKIEDRYGNILQENITEKKGVTSEAVSFIITNILEDVIKKGTARKVNIFQRPIAGKTGTTNRNTDAWFVGYTPQVITGVYVGNDDPSTPLGYLETGSRTAAPIWRDVMIDAAKNYPPKSFRQPKSVKSLKIFSEDGLLACNNSQGSYFEYYKKGNEPTFCSSYQSKTALPKASNNEKEKLQQDKENIDL